MSAQQSLVYSLVKKIILFAFFAVVFTGVAYAAMPSSFHTGRITLSAESEYFWTKSNYDDVGVSRPLPSSNSYSNLTNTFAATYFKEGGWALTGGAGFAYASSSSLEDRTSGKITNFLARAQKLISFSPLRLVPQADLVATTQRVSPETDEVLSHEGAHSVRIGSWLTYDFRLIRTYGYAGFDYRDDGRSSLLPWAGGLGFKTTPWSFTIELNGYQSLTDDEYTDTPLQRTIVTNKVSAGSLRYYSVNPNLIEARAQGGFKFADNYNFNFGYAQTLAGENTAEGQSVFLGLTYNIDTSVTDTQKAASNMSPNESKQQKLKQKRFEPLIEEDYDETLFEEEL